MAKKRSHDKKRDVGSKKRGARLREQALSSNTGFRKRPGTALSGGTRKSFGYEPPAKLGGGGASGG